MTPGPVVRAGRRRKEDEMNDHDKKMARMTAAMGGEEVIVANIGKKVKLSQMELICLVNFAEVGLMSVFSSLEGKNGEEAEASLDEHIERIRKEFGKDGRDGLNRLATSTAALLRGKFASYVA